MNIGSNMNASCRVAIDVLIEFMVIVRQLSLVRLDSVHATAHMIQIDLKEISSFQRTWIDASDSSYSIYVRYIN